MSQILVSLIAMAFFLIPAAGLAGFPRLALNQYDEYADQLDRLGDRVRWSAIAAVMIMLTFIFAPRNPSLLISFMAVIAVIALERLTQYWYNRMLQSPYGLTGLIVKTYHVRRILMFGAVMGFVIMLGFVMMLFFQA